MYIVSGELIGIEMTQEVPYSVDIYNRLQLLM